MLARRHGTKKRARTNLDISDSVKLQTPLPPSCVAFSPCGQYLGIASHNVQIFLSSSVGHSATPVATLEPPLSNDDDTTNHMMITAMAISSTFGLCAAHRDGAFLWDNATKGVNSNEHTILDCVGLKSQIKFNATGSLVAVTVNNVVYVVDVNTKRSIVQLEGHTATITSLAFSPHHSQQLATASEDRSFKLWDIKKRILLYQSSIISSSPFTSLVYDPYRDRLAVGSEDGKLRFYMLSVAAARSPQMDEENDREGRGEGREGQEGDQRMTSRVYVREERTIDIGTLLRKRREIVARAQENQVTLKDGSDPDAALHVVSSLPAWARGGERCDGVGEDDEEVEVDDEVDEEVMVDGTVLSLHFRRDGRLDRGGNSSSSKSHRQDRRKREGLGWHGSGVLDDDEDDDDDDGGIVANVEEQGGDSYWKDMTTWIIVGTPHALVHVDTSAYEIDAVLNFQRDAATSTMAPPFSPSTCVLGGNFPPPPPSSSSNSMLDQRQQQQQQQRHVLSPLSAQAMAMDTARQKQAVPLNMTASCFAFTLLEEERTDDGELTPSSAANTASTVSARRAHRREYYKKRLEQAGGGGEQPKNNEDQVRQYDDKARTTMLADGLLCLVGSAFVPGATVLKLPRNPAAASVPPTPRINDAASTSNSASTAASTAASTSATTAAAVVVAAPSLPPPLSLFPSCPLSINSPLKNSTFKTASTTNSTSSGRRGRRRSALQRSSSTTNTVVVNRPVTFHRNIRSSGYGKNAPIMSLHGKNRRPSKYRSSPSKSTRAIANERYPSDAGIPCHHQRSHQMAMDGPKLRQRLHSGPVQRVQYVIFFLFLLFFSVHVLTDE